jgi:hypothetical protein
MLQDSKRYTARKAFCDGILIVVPENWGSDQINFLAEAVGLQIFSCPKAPNNTIDETKRALKSRRFLKFRDSGGEYTDQMANRLAGI